MECYANFDIVFDVDVELGFVHGRRRRCDLPDERCEFCLTRRARWTAKAELVGDELTVNSWNVDGREERGAWGDAWEVDAMEENVQ